MSPVAERDSECPYCSGPSLVLDRGGHDPACPIAQSVPVCQTNPNTRTQSLEDFVCGDDHRARARLRRHARNAERRPMW